ncbi:MAG: hypothetical protein O3A59_14915 [Nitrospirae bacterium]|nr:hypothetical protein [Nitrospirota bacterium]
MSHISPWKALRFIGMLDDCEVFDGRMLLNAYVFLVVARFQLE